MTNLNQSQTPNTDQIRYWNSENGHKWKQYQQRLDSCFRNINKRLLDYADILPKEQVLEIGCGTGATTLEISDLTEQSGSVLAVDVAQILLDHAIERANERSNHNIEFLLDDAQTHPFPESTFDLLISRFGVMFFNDPAAAFINLVRALKSDGRVAFVSWTNLERNPWFLIPKKAAVQQLGEPDPADPRAPGPFAFSDPDYVQQILRQAKLNDIQIHAEVIQLEFQGSVDDAANLACNLGPATRIIKEKNGSAEDFAVIQQNVSEAFAPYVADTTVQIPAMLNFVCAKR